MFLSSARRTGAALVLMVLATSPVWAAQARQDAVRKPPASVRFIDAPSTERAAARRARLKQECRGRPNAGACLGHTR